MGFLRGRGKTPDVEKLKEKKDFKGLIKALRNKKTQVQETAAEALAEMGEEAVEPLIKAFRGYGAKNLSLYASILVRIGEPAVQPMIEALLRDRGRIRDVRRQAAMALAEIGDERAVKPLCWARLNEPTMTGAREFLIPALRKIAKPPYQPLLGLIEDSDKDTRLGAFETLQEIGDLDVNAIEPLSRALQNSDTVVRQRATYILGNIYDERVIEPLKMALDDRSRFVRGGAKDSLKRVQEKLEK